MSSHGKIPAFKTYDEYIDHRIKDKNIFLRFFHRNIIGFAHKRNWSVSGEWKTWHEDIERPSSLHKDDDCILREGIVRGDGKILFLDVAQIKKCMNGNRASVGED